MKLPIVKHIFVFTTWGQECPHSEPEQFTFDNFQSNHPVWRTRLLSITQAFGKKECLDWGHCTYKSFKIDVKLVKGGL